jgi:phosphonate transport system substrate-binding protein
MRIPDLPACPGAGRRNVRLRGTRPLRCVTFLAPNLFWFYQFLTRRLADRLGRPAELHVGQSYAELADEADVAFVCSLPYVELLRRGEPPVEALAAPVLRGTRYGGRPVSFSDVIVRRDRPWVSFADLPGRSWAYNEPHSQSGYGITRHHLLCRGETNGFFGAVVAAGWHDRAIRLVCTGAVDASAIDAHVLDVALRDQPGLAEQVRVIDTLGPSPVQPVVAARRLGAEFLADLQKLLLDLRHDPAAAPYLAGALVEGFAPVTGSTYEPVREMLDAAEAAGFLTLR